MKLKVEISYYQDIPQDEIELFEVATKETLTTLFTNYKSDVERLLENELEAKDTKINLELE